MITEALVVELIHFSLPGIFCGAIGGLVRFFYVLSHLDGKLSSKGIQVIAYIALGAFSGTLAIFVNFVLSGIYAQVLLALIAGYAFSVMIDGSLGLAGADPAVLERKLAELRQASALTGGN